MTNHAHQQLRTERGAKRIRAYLAGELVADTTSPWLVWERPYYPTYYLAAQDVHTDLVDTGEVRTDERCGEGRVHDVKTARGTAPGAALRYPNSPAEPLRDLVRLGWDAMDEWLEEDEPVYTHPRDPYNRVDILASSGHVRVVIDGVTVADSARPTILFETGLPPRYYLPLTDVRLDLLRPSDTTSHCPYKGTASYWSAEVDGSAYEDIPWMYRTPLPESVKVAGLACFYTEKVELFLDGDLQRDPRPHPARPA